VSVILWRGSNTLSKGGLVIFKFLSRTLPTAGKLNVVSDALSLVNDEEIAAIKASHRLLVDLESSQLKDPDYLDLIEKVEPMPAVSLIKKQQMVL